MPGGEEFDVKNVIDKSVSKSTLKELASKGIHSVKVIDEKMINALIREAVERIIATRTNVLSEQERQKIYDASKRELQVLLQEHQQIKQRADLAERDKGSLIHEVENLQKQLHLTRKMAAEEAKMRFEEGIESQKPLIKEMRDRIELLEKALQEGTKHDQESDFSHRILQELQKMSSSIQSNLESKFHFMEENVSAKLDNQTDQSELRRRLEELGQKDDRVAARIESLVGRMSDTLNRKIQGLQLRALAGGSGDAYEYRLSDAAYDSLLKEELESNLRAIETEEVEGSKVGETLNKLKLLRKGMTPSS